MRHQSRRARALLVRVPGQYLFGALLPFIFIASATSIQSNVAPPEALAPIVLVRSKLPDGCHLALPPRVAGKDRRTTIVSPPPIPGNPWVGDDIGVISHILEMVDPPFPVPDAPPDRKTIASMSLQRARKISDGAAAIYDSGAGLISVYALRYRNVADLGPATPVRKETDDAFEIRRGAVRIIMFGDRSECSGAVAGHIRSALPNGAGR
jgi:hypothetical protein